MDMHNSITNHISLFLEDMFALHPVSVAIGIAIGVLVILVLIAIAVFVFLGVRYVCAYTRSKDSQFPSEFALCTYIIL